MDIDQLTNIKLEITGKAVYTLIYLNNEVLIIIHIIVINIHIFSG